MSKAPPHVRELQIPSLAEGPDLKISNVKLIAPPDDVSGVKRSSPLCVTLTVPLIGTFRVRHQPLPAFELLASDFQL